VNVLPRVLPRECVTSRVHKDVSIELLHEDSDVMTIGKVDIRSRERMLPQTARAHQ